MRPSLAVRHIAAGRLARDVADERRDFRLAGLLAPVLAMRVERARRDIARCPQMYAPPISDALGYFPSSSYFPM